MGLASIAWVGRDNVRLLASWHGFLHTAIANRFAALSFPPENPFFAGEPLPYYWFYHLLGYAVAQLLRLDLLHAFHLLSGLSLIILIVFGALIGRNRFHSNLAGVAIVWLALAGINPLGPGIAFAKHFLRGTPVWKSWDGPVETKFVTNASADDLMTEPMLPAMYVGADWRYGPNLMWFFDVASRAPALAALMVLLYLLLNPDGGWRNYVLIAAASWMVTAFSALIGLGVAAGLIAARRKAFAACLAGAALAAPTYYQMFFRVSGGSDGVVLSRYWLLAACAVLLNYVLLGPLAVLGARDSRTRAVTLCGLLLVVVSIAVDLPEGNEHNLSNAAQLVLAVPAGAAMARIGRKWRLVAAGLLLAFLPAAIATLAAYAHRPAMPLATVGQELIRLPQNGDLNRLYEWIRQSTARDSIFVIDPALPVKMSGNVSELPAFTGRTLFTDLPDYLTTPNRDAAFRAELAGAATRGEALSTQQRQYLARFGRPVYIVTYKGEPAGQPVFRQGGVAVVEFHASTF